MFCLNQVKTVIKNKSSGVDEHQIPLAMLVKATHQTNLNWRKNYNMIPKGHKTTRLSRPQKAGELLHSNSVSDNNTNATGEPGFFPGSKNK